ncbi:MAG: hypothetical protein IPO08_24575 [Xanthomonadales bacterium]|nr:hypothetical protein [Xanthomonadales bacterium]
MRFSREGGAHKTKKLDCRPRGNDGVGHSQRHDATLAALAETTGFDIFKGEKLDCRLRGDDGV